MSSALSTQLPLPLPPASPYALKPLRVGSSWLLAEFVRQRRARHYILRVTERGTLRVTIPRGGSLPEAERFVRSRHEWILQERFRQLTRATHGHPWADGTVVLVGGQPRVLRVRELEGRRWVELGDLAVPLSAGRTDDLRPAVERALRALAVEQLPARLRELAGRHGFAVAGVSVRAQRTRWGSCSPSGRISLNWRLVQAPPDVRDYVLLHELTHLTVQAHSRRFWRALARVCPGFEEARAWLRARQDEL